MKSLQTPIEISQQAPTRSTHRTASRRPLSGIAQRASLAVVPGTDAGGRGTFSGFGAGRVPGNSASVRVFANFAGLQPQHARLGGEIESDPTSRDDFFSSPDRLFRAPMTIGREAIASFPGKEAIGRRKQAIKREKEAIAAPGSSSDLARKRSRLAGSSSAQKNKRASEREQRLLQDPQGPAEHAQARFSRHPDGYREVPS